MARIVIVNGSPKRTGYWGNELRGSSLLLLTHCAAATELAVSSKRGDLMFWYPAGMGGGFRGPIELNGWSRNEGFFTLHFGRIDEPATPLRNARQVDKVLPSLKGGQHLVILNGTNVTEINLMSPQPRPEEVEYALLAADVPPV